jgi:hypothetical protein
VHVTCLAHALNLVAEKIRYQYEDVDNLISNVKKKGTFLKLQRKTKRNDCLHTILTRLASCYVLQRHFVSSI